MKVLMSAILAVSLSCSLFACGEKTESSNETNVVQEKSSENAAHQKIYDGFKEAYETLKMINAEFEKVGEFYEDGTNPTLEDIKTITDISEDDLLDGFLQLHPNLELTIRNSEENYHEGLIKYYDMMLIYSDDVWGEGFSALHARDLIHNAHIVARTYDDIRSILSETDEELTELNSQYSADNYAGKLLTDFSNKLNSLISDCEENTSYTNSFPEAFKELTTVAEEAENYFE